MPVSSPIKDSAAGADGESAHQEALRAGAKSVQPGAAAAAALPAPAQAAAEPHAQQEAPWGEVQLPAQAPEVVPGGQAFLDDVINMVNDYIADGFDSFEEFAATNLPMNEDTAKLVAEAIQNMFLHLQTRADTALNGFEEGVTSQCFTAPPEIGCQQAAACLIQTSGSQEQEEELDKRLANLRKNIALSRAASKQTRRDIQALNRQIAWSGESAVLEQVLSKVDSNSINEGAAELAECAAKLRPLLGRAEQLRLNLYNRTDRNPLTASVTATKAVNRRRLGVAGATEDDLRRLRMKLTQEE